MLIRILCKQKKSENIKIRTIKIVNDNDLKQQLINSDF